MAGRTGSRRDLRTLGNGPRSGRAAVALCPGRIRAGALHGGWAAARPPARKHKAIGCGHGERLGHRRRTDHHDYAAGRSLESARDQLRECRGRLDPPGASLAIRFCRPLRRNGSEHRILGAAKSDLGRSLGLARPLSLPEHGPPLRRCADLDRRRVIRPHSRSRLGARDQILQHRRSTGAALRARRLYARFPADVRRTARRGALSPSGRCHVRAGRVDCGDGRLFRALLACRQGAPGDAPAARSRDRLPHLRDRQRAGAGPFRRRLRPCADPCDHRHHLHGSGGRGASLGAQDRCTLECRRGGLHRRVHGTRSHLEQRAPCVDGAAAGAI